MPFQRRQLELIEITLIVALVLIGCGRAAITSPVQSPSASSQNTESPKINPCSLLTNDEVAMQVDLTQEPKQREIRHQKGVRHQISTNLRQGGWPVCEFSWRSVDA